MGKKFVVTEEEKKRIKGLYENQEQPELNNNNNNNNNNNDMSIKLDIIMHVTELEFTVYPTNRDESDDDGATVILEYANPLNDNDFKIKSINNMSDIFSDDQVVNYVNDLIQNDYFKQLPTVVYYDSNTGDIEKPY